MIFGLFRSGPSPSTVALYSAIVTEARRVEFYAAYGVPDTPTARFDMVVLHLALVVRRLRADPSAAVVLPAEGRRKPRTTNGRVQELIELFFEEMDRALREMGVGDVGVPKRMKKLVAAWNGRIRVYDAALLAGDRDALADAIARNVLAEARDRGGATALADHAAAAAAALADQPLERLLAGLIDWPDPALRSPGITP
ncbi:MAG: ubiquinol-cytochrome C chaperone [Siculibacillus sp.]|nr:ubiquinol-cytochrome C chaperone [Siculibacillus sp.]